MSSGKRDSHSEQPSRFHGRHEPLLNKAQRMKGVVRCDQISNNHKASFTFQTPCIAAWLCSTAPSQLPSLHTPVLVFILPRCYPLPTIGLCQQSTMRFELETCNYTIFIIIIRAQHCIQSYIHGRLRSWRFVVSAPYAESALSTFAHP
jgi:hypothetical protein